MISNFTYCAVGENSCKLTVASLAAMLSSVAHIGGAGLVSRNVAAQPQTCGFFVPKISVHHVMAGWAEHSQEWPGATSVDQLCSVCHPMIGLIWWRVYNLIRVAIMNNHIQNPLVALFNIYHARKLVASNVPGVRAIRLKQRNSALIVKFDRMGGAA